LDLHGNRYEDARRKVINFIEDHWNDGSELEIITGNSMKMKGIVFNVLDEYKLTYQVSHMNVGKIITWT
jgi:DNA-nicking Smr family endonuclease